MRRVWSGEGKKVMTNPKARIIKRLGGLIGTPFSEAMYASIGYFRRTAPRGATRLGLRGNEA